MRRKMQRNNTDNTVTTSDETEPLIANSFRTMNLCRKQIIYYIVLPCLLASILAFIIGFLSGYLPNKSNNDDKNVDVNLYKYYETLIKDIDNSYFEQLSNEMNAENIRGHLRNMTSIPHLAGTDGDLISAQYVLQQFQEQKLDYFKLIDYQVYLSYPDETRPNSIEILDNNDTIIESINITEPILDDNLNFTNTPAPFLAFANNGSIDSDEVYYVNYCSESDFKFIQTLNISVVNKTVICRYGQIFRGDKVMIAERARALAVILYDDPYRSAPDAAKNEIYRNGEFLPSFGTQRGTLFTGAGDPQTPLYPSTDDAYRVDVSTVSDVPKIVAQVIGYEHALKIFQMMQNNTQVKSDWQGIMNVTYTYGGILANGQKLRVNVYNQRKQVTTYNVVGMIEGTVEPDRYVMIGNHRDAWVFGSIDPTSGTATLVEMSRALSKLKQSGWKPRRSIVFLSWGAEEYGLVGSTEWAEEFTKKLISNAVAYLNLDISVQGNYSYTARASPLLHELIYNVTKKVKMTPTETVFDRWLNYSNSKITPYISTGLGAGSDYMAFQQRIGIPCMDSRFNHDKSAKYSGIGTGYPLYHTNYETFYLVDTYIDPGFNSFRLIAIITAEIARTLSDSLIYPLKPTYYANEMKILLEELKIDYGNDLKQQNISLDGLVAAINNYTIAANNFQEKLNSINRNHIQSVYQFNEQLRNLERAFINPGSIERKGYMHVLSAPSLFNSYAGDGFPGLGDAIYNAKDNPSDSAWNDVRLQLSIVIYAIKSACTILDQPNSFERYFNN